MRVKKRDFKKLFVKTLVYILGSRLASQLLFRILYYNNKNK